MRTIKKAQDGVTDPPKKTWQQMTQGEKGAKKKELVERGGIQLFNTYKDSIGKQAMGRIQTEFEKGAKSKGMTNEEYSKWLEKQKRKPDVNQGDGGFKEKSYRAVCGKGGCKSGRSGLRIKKAQEGMYIKGTTAAPRLPKLKKLSAEEMKGRTKVDLSKFKKAKPKAKDGMWMQKAAASIKRRGTEGKCTPITKPGCTGKAKALAKTFKKIAAKRKSK
jgi:hypothetical protein